MVHIMKSMGFIKPWRVDKIVSLRIYLKIMMSLPWSKYKLSHLYFLFFFFCFLFFVFKYESKGAMTIIWGRSKDKEKKPSPFLSVALSISFSWFPFPPTFSRLFGFHFLEKGSSLFLFVHFLNPHKALWWLSLRYILHFDLIIPDLRLVHSCWDSTCR